MQLPNSRRDRRGSNAASREGETGGSLMRFVLTVAVLAWALRSFIAAPFSIPSGSMLPTLYIGDYLVVAKWPYGYSRYSFPFGFPSFPGRVFGHAPKRGDVVVFRHPTEDEDLIKRVIGLPGDTVAVAHGRVILNGAAVPDQPIAPVKIAVTANSPCKTVAPAARSLIAQGNASFCAYRAYRETLPAGPSFIVLDQVDHSLADDFPEVRVPPGHVFLMGDNRDDSLDSRYGSAEGGIGMVPVDHLIGKAVVTFWSTNGSASYWKPWTWFTALRWDRLGNGYLVAAK